jgi:hypothetical protein
MDSSSADRAKEVADKEKGHLTAGNNFSDDDIALAALRRITTDEPGHPIHWPTWKKWVITSIYCLLQTFVTLTSTTYVSAEFLVEEQFNVSNAQVVALGQSMFILGTAVGPAFLGPLSYVSWSWRFSRGCVHHRSLTTAAVTLAAGNGSTSPPFSHMRLSTLAVRSP